MKSGAELLVAGVRALDGFLAPVFPFGLPLCVEACSVFFLVTPDVDGLAGAFFAGAFLVLAMISKV